MYFNFLTLISGTFIAALSIIYGFDKIESFQDPLFVLCLVGMSAVIVSYLIQPFLVPREKHKNGRDVKTYKKMIPEFKITPQMAMLLASLFVIILTVSYLYSTIPKKAG